MNRIIDYSFNADNDAAFGKMRFYYKDLKLNILERGDSSDFKNKAFATFFANTFVVHQKNPKFLYRKRVDIFYERDPQKGIFDYWAKSVLSGLAGSVGAINTRKKIRKFQNSGVGSSIGN